MKPGLAVLLLIGGALSVSAETLYQVTFKPFTAFGEPSPAHVTAFYDPLHRRDLASHCAGLVCSKIPEGPYTYSLALDATGKKVDGTAVVYRTNQVVAVDVGNSAGEAEEPDFPTIQGTIANAEDPKRLWIRLQPFFGDSSVSAAVNDDGRFQIEQVRPGKWMMLVFSEGKLVHYEPLTCREKDNPPVTITLTPARPMIKVRNRGVEQQPRRAAPAMLAEAQNARP